MSNRERVAATPVGEDRDEPSQALRVLIANEDTDNLDAIAAVLEGLGHQVVARDVRLDAIGETTRQVFPDVALVGLGKDPAYALNMISKIVHEAACPVIALLDFDDPDYVNEAAKRGVFAYVIMDDHPSALQSALDITLRRFAEFQNLQGAFGRRAVIERAKGILMERHSIDDQQAFELLRRHSRESRRKLIDIAQAIMDSHSLLADKRRRPTD